MACLVFSDNAGRQVVFPLDRERSTIGRGPDNDVVSIDLRVSRRHASIQHDQATGLFRVHDEGSALGVFVNQKRILKADLQDGDVIRLGESLYSFVDIPHSPMGRVASRVGSDSESDLSGQTASDAGLRGSALVAEVQEAVANLQRLLPAPAEATAQEVVGTDARREERSPVAPALRVVESRLEGLRQHLIRLERARLMMQTLYEVGRVINSSYSREDLLDVIVDLAVKVIRAERGFLTLLDRKSGEFLRRAAVNMADGAQSASNSTGTGASTEAGAKDATGHDFSVGIARTVAQSGQPVVTTDAMADRRFRERQSVVDLNIRSALCVPLFNRAQQVMGVLYLDTRASVVIFNREDSDFLMAFANYAAIAIENAALFLEAAAKARAEEELRQARKMEQIKSDLIAVVSHDVRTPLTSIKSYAEILQDDFDTIEPARRRHFLEIINREADRLSRLVTNYLDLQKIEAGMMRLAIAPLEVAALVEESMEAFEGAALEKAVALSRTMAPSLPAVRGDRDRLLQVFANLLSNALKFTPPGGSVTVTARPALLQGRGRAVEITVKDTGEGIPADKIDALFQRFAQLHTATEEQSQKKGTGLGLVFAKEIVELHGGKISAESRAGEGAAFRVMLPVDGP